MPTHAQTQELLTKSSSTFQDLWAPNEYSEFKDPPDVGNGEFHKRLHYSSLSVAHADRLLRLIWSAKTSLTSHVRDMPRSDAKHCREHRGSPEKEASI